MTAIGVDPGAYSPAHALLTLHGAITQDTPFPDPVIEIPIFVEGLAARDYVSRQSMLTLGFYWGLHVGPYLDRGHPVFAIPIPVWRNEVLRRSEMLPKDILHQRVDIPANVRAAGPDACDAYLIAKAGASLLRRGYKLEQVTWIKPRTQRKKQRR